MREPPTPPSLTAYTGALLAAGARFVVVGGFAVVAHRHVRATLDVDVLIPDDADNDERCVAALVGLQARRLSDDAAIQGRHLTGVAHLRVLSPSAGILDLIREGDAPLDFASVEAAAVAADLGAGTFKVAGLRSVVAFKRLADRPVDRNDLDALRAIHGELPIDPVPGLDDA